MSSLNNVMSFALFLDRSTPAPYCLDLQFCQAVMPGLPVPMTPSVKIVSWSIITSTIVSVMFWFIILLIFTLDNPHDTNFSVRTWCSLLVDVIVIDLSIVHNDSPLCIFSKLACVLYYLFKLLYKLLCCNLYRVAVHISKHTLPWMGSRYLLKDFFLWCYLSKTFIALNGSSIHWCYTDCLTCRLTFCLFISHDLIRSLFPYQYYVNSFTSHDLSFTIPFYFRFTLLPWTRV